MQTLTRRGVGDAAAGLSLHFLFMSECPFWHDAGHMGFVDRRSLFRGQFLIELAIRNSETWSLSKGGLYSEVVFLAGFAVFTYRSKT